MKTKTPSLQRILSVSAGMAVSMGVAIGAGIFRNPGEVAALLPSGVLITLAWLVGGLLTLVDALVLAELSTSMPKAGGWYVYLRAAYGDLAAFLYGWSSSLGTYPGSIAAVAVAIGEYTGKLVVPVGKTLGIPIQYGPMATKGVAVASIIVFTLLNLLGLRVASWAQQVFTSIKVLALLLIVGLAFGVSGSSAPNLVPPVATQVGGWIAFGIALQFVVWTYDGYADVITLAEEVREPERSLPRALLGSIGLLTGLYVLINFAFLYVLTPGEMSTAKELVAEEVVTRRIGLGGGLFLAVLALITVVGGLNAHLLSGPRITFAMARDGLSFSWLTSVTKGGTPVGALLLQSICAVILTMTGTFETLISMTIFIIWITNTLNIVAVFIFRSRFPNASRPFLMPGYPLVPILALGISACLLFNMVYDSRHQMESGWKSLLVGHWIESLSLFSASPVLIGIIIILAGIPVYWFWRNTFTRIEG